jgi:hypothetical protein
MKTASFTRLTSLRAHEAFKQDLCIKYVCMCEHRGVGLVDSISLPVVPGSIRAAARLAAVSSVNDFTVV